MAYLLISVACSVLVSVLLKLRQRRGIDTAQGITWNYVIGFSFIAVGAFFVFRGPL